MPTFVRIIVTDSHIPLSKDEERELRMMVVKGQRRIARIKHSLYETIITAKFYIPSNPFRPTHLECIIKFKQANCKKT